MLRDLSYKRKGKDFTLNLYFFKYKNIIFKIIFRLSLIAILLLIKRLVAKAAEVEKPKEDKTLNKDKIYKKKILILKRLI